jgi:hypothetical protein
MRFGNLLTMMHFGTLSAELTKRSMELFAAKVLPAIQALGAQAEPAAA